MEPCSIQSRNLTKGRTNGFCFFPSFLSCDKASMRQCKLDLLFSKDVRVNSLKNKTSKLDSSQETAALPSPWLPPGVSLYRNASNQYYLLWRSNEPTQTTSRDDHVKRVPSIACKLKQWANGHWTREPRVQRPISDKEVHPRIPKTTSSEKMGRKVFDGFVCFDSPQKETKFLTFCSCMRWVT